MDLVLERPGQVLAAAAEALDPLAAHGVVE
jgi:hypothetical protein